MLDLTQLSIEDLVKLQNDLPRALEKKQNEQRKLFIAGIEELAKKLAITDILTALQPYLTRLQNKQKNANSTINAVSNFAKPSIVQAKYRDPMNFNRTWAGRGSKPNWVNEYLSANPDKTIDDLLIKNDEKPLMFANYNNLEELTQENSAEQSNEDLTENNENPAENYSTL